MKLPGKIIVAVLSAIALVSGVAFQCAFWYEWHLASRVPDPSRGLIHAVRLGTREEGGTEFNVYLSSTEWVLACPELYISVCVIALALLMSRLWWRSPAPPSTAVTRAPGKNFPLDAS